MTTLSETPRLILWPTISPRGHQPPGPAFYLSWPGWERHRVEKLGEEPVFEGLAPILVDEPAGFAVALAALAEAAFDSASPSGLPLHPDGPEGASRLDVLSGGRPKAEGPRPERDRLLLALWSSADSQNAESERLAAKALGRRRELLAALSGEPDPKEAPPWPFPPPPPPPPWLAGAWLRLAGPILEAGDLLWSPWPGYGEEAGLAAKDPRLSLPPGDLLGFRP